MADLGECVMKRISTVVLAATAAAALVLTGCSSEEPEEASGLRKNTATGQSSPQPGSETGAANETSAPSESSEVPEAPEAPGQTSAAAETPASGRASDTTCAQFARLDEPEQQQLVQKILAETPDSTFAGNPSSALGTAKLVCNSSKLADQKVAVVAGIVVNG